MKQSKGEKSKESGMIQSDACKVPLGYMYVVFILLVPPAKY